MSQYLSDAGFDKKNVKAGLAGEQRLLAASRKHECDGRLIVPGVTVSYMKDGKRKKADADLVVVVGNELHLIDAKLWKTGKYRRVVLGLFGHVYCDTGQLIPKKTRWPEHSALKPVGEALVTGLHAAGFKKTTVGSRFTVMVNPKSKVSWRLRKATVGTTWKNYASYLSWLEHVKPGDAETTREVADWLRRKSVV